MSRQSDQTWGVHYCNGMDGTHNSLVAQWFRVHGICLGGLRFNSLQGYSLCDQVTLGVTSWHGSLVGELIKKHTVWQIPVLHACQYDELLTNCDFIIHILYHLVRKPVYA